MKVEVVVQLTFNLYQIWLMSQQQENYCYLFTVLEFQQCVSEVDHTDYFLEPFRQLLELERIYMKLLRQLTECAN